MNPLKYQLKNKKQEQSYELHYTVIFFPDIIKRKSEYVNPAFGIRIRLYNVLRQLEVLR